METAIAEARRSDLKAIFLVSPEHLHGHLAGQLPPGSSSRLALKLGADTIFLRLRGQIASGDWFLMVRRIHFRRQEVFHTLYVSSKTRPEQLVRWRRETMVRWSGILDHLGISIVRCHANLELGGYLWAAAGFLPEDGQQWRVVRDYARQAWGELRGHVEPQLSGQEIGRVDRLLGIDKPQGLTIWAAQFWRNVNRAKLRGTRFDSPSGVNRSLGNLLLAGELLMGRLATRRSGGIFPLQRISAEVAIIYGRKSRLVHCRRIRLV